MQFTEQVVQRNADLQSDSRSRRAGAIAGAEVTSSASTVLHAQSV
ncbi:hypothetical protein ABZY20_16575 [Streptomyces sp. NPDC006624]